MSPGGLASTSVRLSSSSELNTGKSALSSYAMSALKVRVGLSVSNMSHIRFSGLIFQALCMLSWTIDITGLLTDLTSVMSSSAFFSPDPLPFSLSCAGVFPVLEGVILAAVLAPFGILEVRAMVRMEEGYDEGRDGRSAGWGELATQT